MSCSPTSTPPEKGIPMPSYSKFSILKPREVKAVRSVSNWSTVTDGALRKASFTLLSLKSSICSRVTTVMACGVSLSVRPRRVVLETGLPR
ncbi:hypothetical protein D3C73_1130110 [compost metagenome]